MVTHPSFGKMICYSAILLLSLFFEPNLGQDETASTFEGLASLISNIVSLDNSDLVFISDFHNSQQDETLAELSSLLTLYRLYDIETLETLQKSLKEEPCPMFLEPHHRRRRAAIDHDDHHGKHEDSILIPRDEMHQRDSLIPIYQYHPTYIIWIKDIPRLLNVFDQTIMKCKQKIDVGIYNSDARFFFVIDQEEGDVKAEEIFHYNDYLYRHPQTAVIKKIDSAKIKYKIYGYNFFHKANDHGEVIVNFVWSPESPLTNIKAAFTDMKHFHGQTLNIATNPWSHHVLGEEIPKEDPEWSETNKYRNYWGYEIEMLKDTAKALNFTYTIENPPDGKWGHIEPDGNWNGLVYYVSKDNVDIVICDVFIVYGRQQVFDGTIPFDEDYLVHSAPNPSLLPKWLGFIYPFQYLIWILIGVSIFAYSLVFYIVARSEGAVMGKVFKQWHSLSGASWYTFGTIMGETFENGEVQLRKSHAVRIVVAVWILYCLIITQSYAGNLKAYLTTPAYSKPIDTLQEVIESNLPWGMVLYGEEEEELMANSEDPIIQTIWNDKIVAEYNQVPQIRPVYEGKKIFIDWKSGLEPAIFARYSTGDGNPLIHIASRPVFMPNYPGWAFYKWNPYRNRFNQVLRRLIEAGLVHHYKLETWYGMRKEYLESDEEKIEYFIRPNISPMNVDDLQGCFYIGGMILALSLVTFMFEYCIFWINNKQTSNFDNESKK